MLLPQEISPYMALIHIFGSRGKCQPYNILTKVQRQTTPQLYLDCFYVLISIMATAFGLIVDRSCINTISDQALEGLCDMKIDSAGNLNKY